MHLLPFVRPWASVLKRTTQAHWENVPSCTFLRTNKYVVTGKVLLHFVCKSQHYRVTSLTDYLHMFGFSGVTCLLSSLLLTVPDYGGRVEQTGVRVPVKQIFLPSLPSKWRMRHGTTATHFKGNGRWDSGWFNARYIENTPITHWENKDNPVRPCAGCTHHFLHA